MRQMDLSVVQCVDPLNGTVDKSADSSADLQGWDSAQACWFFGASGDTLSGSVKIDCLLEESDDDSTWTAVADADMVGTEATVDDAAEDDAVYVVDYIGTKRYLRASFDFTGTHTNGIPVASAIIRSRARHAS